MATEHYGSPTLPQTGRAIPDCASYTPYSGKLLQISLRDGTDPSRASKRDEDKKVADLLASRAVLSPVIEENFRTHLANATAIAPEVPEEPPTDAQKEYEQAALEFHVSLTEWRELARQTISRARTTRNRARLARLLADTCESLILTPCPNPASTIRYGPGSP